MKRIHAIYLGFIYFLLYLPIIVLAAYSFNAGKYSSTWQGFTFHWYKTLFANDEVITATINSLLIAFLSATLSVVLGALFSLWLLHRQKKKQSKYIAFLLYGMIMMPDIILGISLLILFVILQIPLGFSTLLLSHIAFELPFVMITLMARLNALDASIIEAAQDLGAKDVEIVKLILLPLLLPALLTAWVLSFTLSLDDVVISSFVGGSGFEILPLKIYSMARLGVDPQINALCFILFILALGAALFSNYNNKQP